MIILVDPVYNPEFQSSINSATRLAPGVTIAKFLGAYGDRTSFNHVESESTRKQIARNLYQKLSSFGWGVQEINGHDLEELKFNCILSVELSSKNL